MESTVIAERYFHDGVLLLTEKLILPSPAEEKIAKYYSDLGEAYSSFLVNKLLKEEEENYINNPPARPSRYSGIKAFCVYKAEENDERISVELTFTLTKGKEVICGDTIIHNWDKKKEIMLREKKKRAG